MSSTFVGAQSHTVPMAAVVATDDPDAIEAAERREPPMITATLVLPRLRSDEVTAPAKPRARRRLWVDAGVFVAFVLIAFAVTYQYWLTGHVSAGDVSDQAFFEYMLAHGAHSLVHLSNPLFASQLNVPVGVNLMDNTSILALAIPLTPITLWLGPATSFALLMTFGLAATAGAWYFVLSRHVVTSRSAAIIGGLVAGFGPGMISHTTGHPNIIAQFLVPFIAWQTLRLREPGRALRNGLGLGALAVVQVFINEEVLFNLAFGLAVFIAMIAVSKRRTISADVRPFLAGLGVAVAFSAVLLAYPLWWQFFGPNTYHGLSAGVKAFSTDVAAFPAFGTQSIFGSITNDAHLSQSIAEQNTFFGWPMLIAVVAAIYWLRRQVVARALAAAGLVLALLSLGATIKVDGHDTGIPGPWRLVGNLPVFNAAVPTRISLLILPIVATLIALAHDKAMVITRTKATSKIAARPRARQMRFAWCFLVGLALVASIPTPIPTQKLAPTPAFISSGEFRAYVSLTQTVLPVPLPGPGVVDSMFWAARSNLAFQLPRGYFLGPDPTSHDVAFFGAPARPTAVLIADVISDDEPAIVQKSDRKAAIADLRFWHVAVIVQTPNGPADKALRTTISDLVGAKPKFIGGVWVWDVRKLTAGKATSDL
jgi:hypothetical protein